MSAVAQSWDALLSSRRDPHGNTYEQLVSFAVSGMVVWSPKPWLYEPDEYPPAVIEEAKRRLKNTLGFIEPRSQPGINKVIDGALSKPLALVPKEHTFLPEGQIVRQCVLGNSSIPGSNGLSQVGSFAQQMELRGYGD